MNTPLARIQTPNDPDPSLLGYPPGLTIELALQEHDIETICRAYRITEEQWDVIRMSPIFISDLRARMIELQADGVSFKMKARLQASEYLKKLWTIADDEKNPVAIRASIMTSVIRMAGLDGSKDQANAAVSIGNALSIHLHLG